MIVTETKELCLERTELYKRLDTPYDSEADKERDELRLGEIELEIRKIVNEKIKSLKDDIPKFEKILELKIDDIKSARKLRKEKRDVYKELAKETYNLYLELVDKKKMGAELEDKLKSKNVGKYDLKRLISEVRRY